MALTGPQYKRLLETLPLAYTYDELRLAVKSCMDVDLNSVVTQEKNYNQQLAELIDWVERQGRTQDLLRCAYESNKTNPQLAALWQDAQEWHSDAARPESTPVAVQQRPKKGRTVPIIMSIVLFVTLAAFLGIYAAMRSPSCTAFQEANGTVVVEAEHFTDRVPGREHSTRRPVRSGVGIEWRETREGIMQAEPDLDQRNTMSETNGSALIYAIDFTSPGQYQVYVRGYGVNQDGDSIHVGLNGNAITTNKMRGLDLPDDFGEPRWVSHDGDGDPTYLTIPAPGVHKLYIWMRENGVAVDKIWLDMGRDKVQNGDSEPNPDESSCRSEWDSWFSWMR